MKFAPFFFCIFLAFTSCVVDEPDLSRYIGSGIENTEQASDIEVVYTDSSYLIFILKAPVSRRVFSKFSVTEEFPQGIDVTFYDKSRTPRSWLTSDFAVRDQANRKITVQKNVILHNDQGERMEGPELIWDERTKEIYTDRFVKITRGDGTIVYSYGFKSNEGFTRYELNSVSGNMNISDLDASASPDSTIQKPVKPDVK